MGQQATVDWMDFQRHGGIVEIRAEICGSGDGEIVTVTGHLPGGARIVSLLTDELIFDCKREYDQKLVQLLQAMGCEVYIG